MYFCVYMPIKPVRIRQRKPLYKRFVFFRLPGVPRGKKSSAQNDLVFFNSLRERDVLRRTKRKSYTRSEVYSRIKTWKKATIDTHWHGRIRNGSNPTDERNTKGIRTNDYSTFGHRYTSNSTWEDPYQWQIDRHNVHCIVNIQSFPFFPTASQIQFKVHNWLLKSRN